MLLNNISCIDYEDNVNPNEVTEEMMEADNLKTGAFFSQMLRRVVIVNDGDKLDSDYQIAQNLSHDLYSGYIAATLGSTNHNGQYNFQEQWVNATFDYAYTGIMAPWQSIHKIATEQELPEVDALATIVKVEGMHRIADTFGPIPYVNYGSSSLYDALDLVYNKFFEELDNAIGRQVRRRARHASPLLFHTYRSGGQMSFSAEKTGRFSGKKFQKALAFRVFQCYNKDNL